MIGSKSKHVAIHGDTCSSSQRKIPHLRSKASIIFSFCQAPAGSGARSQVAGFEQATRGR